MQPQPETNLDQAARMTKRYTDGYRVARTIDLAGLAIKSFTILAGVIAAIVGLSNSPSGEFAAALPGAIIALTGWIFGVLVSAQGQVLKAGLDGAVHTSPFLTNEQRAHIMSLD